MTKINQFRNPDIKRQERNSTINQKRNHQALVEGTIVNSYVKDDEFLPLKETRNAILIPLTNEEMPKEITSKHKQENFIKKEIMPLTLATVGLFAAVAGSTKMIQLAAKKKTQLPTWKTLPEIPRNIALNEETHFATYVALQNPNRKTIIGAFGVFVLSAVGLIGKNFVDGMKAIWVKKQEAEIQRDLQEKLIKVETQTFSGKLKILRAMLAEKTKEFEQVLKGKETKPNEPKEVSFKANPQKPSSDNFNSTYALIGGIGLAAMGLFTYMSLKNLQKTAKMYDGYKDRIIDQVKTMVKNTNAPTQEDKNVVKKVCTTLNADEKTVKDILGNLNLPKKELDEFTQQTIKESQSLTQEAAEAIAGKPGNKASFYSHVNDVRGHFYNWIVNFDSPILASLFVGLAGVTSIGYAGTKAVEAIKERQVAKINAQTEYNLQKQLVDVELKNFYTKKKSAIDPLVKDFHKHAQSKDSNGDLKTVAENILLEIKNGPPFIYS